MSLETSCATGKRMHSAPTIAVVATIGLAVWLTIAYAPLRDFRASVTDSTSVDVQYYSRDFSIGDAPTVVVGRFLPDKKRPTLDCSPIRAYCRQEVPLAEMNEAYGISRPVDGPAGYRAELDGLMSDPATRCSATVIGPGRWKILCISPGQGTLLYYGI